jgi:hypothetical protein
MMHPDPQVLSCAGIRWMQETWAHARMLTLFRRTAKSCLQVCPARLMWPRQMALAGRLGWPKGHVGSGSPSILSPTLERCSFPDYGAFCVAWPLSSVFLAWLILCWGSVGLVFRKQPRSSTALVGHGTICTEWEPPITCEWGRFHPLRLPHSFPHTMEKGAWKQAPARHSEWGSLALARAPRNPQACAM